MKFNLCIFSTLLFLSACSPNGKLSLKGVDVGTSTVGSDTYVNMEAIIVMGNLKLPNIEVPILNPSNLHSLGQMALQHLDDGSNRILVSIDYDEATRLDPALGKSLPNQRELPSQLGIGKTTIVGIPILDQSRVYVGGDLKKDLFIGAAIAIPALDSVLNQVPVPLNIFFNFPFSTQVLGEAGIFTGTQKGQNGLAVFVKRTAPTPADSKVSAMRSLASVSIEDTTSLPTGGEELKKMNTITLFKLDRLLNKHATVRVK